MPVHEKTPLKQNALSHQIKFEVNTAASLSPRWELERLVINESGVIASASRNRVHDLIYTFGPYDKATDKGLSGAAADVFLASQIQSVRRFEF